MYKSPYFLPNDLLIGDLAASTSSSIWMEYVLQRREDGEMGGEGRVSLSNEPLVRRLKLKSYVVQHVQRYPFPLS